VSKEVSRRDSKSPVSGTHAVAMGAVAVVGVIVAFVVLSSVVGVIFEVVKVAVVVALIGGVFWLVSRFRR
jgi:uncharacterized membrane protein